MSVVRVSQDGEGIGDGEGFVNIPRRWSFILVGGALGYLVAAVFAATMIYARVGDLEVKTTGIDRLVESRHQISERRWEELHRMNERVVRVETQLAGMNRILERIEHKLDNTDTLRIPR